MKRKYLQVLTICAIVFAVTITPFAAGAEDFGVLIGEYETSYSLKAPNRCNNIRICAETLDGAVIPVGGEFSFNAAIGPTTADKGYKRAAIFIKGQKRYGVGGGVCQVSGTLYNAVLSAGEGAGFDVTERHAHSRRVTYVPKGFDAATSYGGIDFKFVNNSGKPVKIVTYLGEDEDGGYVGVKLYQI